MPLDWPRTTFLPVGTGLESEESHTKRFVITAGYPYASDNSTDTIKVVERK